MKPNIFNLFSLVKIFHAMFQSYIFLEFYCVYILSTVVKSISMVVKSICSVKFQFAQC